MAEAPSTPPASSVYVCHTQKGQALIRVVHLSPDMTLDELKALAAQKMGVDTPFASLALQNGAEITSLDDIQPDDVLYCGTEAGDQVPTAGSNPLAGDQAVPAWSAEDMSPEYKERFLCSLASSLAKTAASLYGQGSAMVKGHTPQMVGSAIDGVESRVATLSKHRLAQSMLNQAIAYGEWVDDKLDSGLVRAKHTKEEILASPTADQINTKVVQPVKRRVIEPTTAFVKSATGVFSHLQSRAVAQGTAAKVSAEEFVAALKQRVGQHWSTDLAEPARAFHEAATRNIQSVRSTLGRAWEDRVAAAWRSTPADEAKAPTPVDA